MSFRKKRGTSTNSRKYNKNDSKIDFEGANEDSSDEENANYGKRRRRDLDEDVSSDEDDVDDSSESEEEEEVEETVEAKKIRLAKEYLSTVSEKIGDSDSSGSSSEEDDEDEDEESVDDHTNIARKLAKERLKRGGLLSQAIAKKVRKSIFQMYTTCGILPQTDSDDITNNTFPSIFTNDQTSKFVSSPYMKQLRGHDLTPTCVSLHKSGSIAYSGSKDNSVLSWDVEYAKKLHTVVPEWKKTDMEFSRGSGEVLALANSDDGRYLAVGGRDCTVRIFDVRLLGKGLGSSATGTKRSSSLVTTFEGHKGPVTSLAFRTHTLQLFSGSEDRCIRNYNLDQMLYTETLYGHQGPITALSCHLLARPLSTGRDRTLRAWKISDESHLIFRGGSKATAADCVASIKDDWCLTGHEDGAVSLWFTEKKKPVSYLEREDYCDESEIGASRGTSIVCADALRGSDLAMTGSNDGVLRLWQLKTGKSVDDRGIVPLARIPVHGFVNGVAIGPKGRFCVAAIGQEHRLGRWDRVAKAKNRFAIISLRQDDEEDDKSDNEEVNANEQGNSEEEESSSDEELNKEEEHEQGGEPEEESDDGSSDDDSSEE